MIATVFTDSPSLPLFIIRAERQPRLIIRVQSYKKIRKNQEKILHKQKKYSNFA